MVGGPCAKLGCLGQWCNIRTLLFETHDPNVLYTDKKKQKAKGPRPRDLLTLNNGYFGSDTCIFVNAEELDADSKLLGVDAGVIIMMAMTPMFASGDTREGERVLKLSEFRSLTRLRGKIARELNMWRKVNAEKQRLIRIQRGCSPSQRTMDFDEHMEWIDTESSMAPTVWGMLTKRLMQRVRFERYRLRCSAMDKLIDVLFPLQVSFICGFSWNVERVFVCPYFSTFVTNMMHVEYRRRRGVFVHPIWVVEYRWRRVGVDALHLLGTILCK